MSVARTLLLGAIAGVTIFLGLPLGRLGPRLPRTRHFLNAVAIGILVFLVWDVLAHAWEPLDEALAAVHEHTGGMGRVVGYALVFFGGLGIGLLGLLWYEGLLAKRATAAGPDRVRGIATWSDGRRLALLIAVGIGLHNFGEGLAIGSSAGRNEVSLATILVIGFALHNGTEGFGIVAPLAGEPERPSWAFLLVLGLIGGGPTFIGTAIGRSFTNDVLDIAFLTLAAGSILYVVIQLLGVAQRVNKRDVLLWGVFVGLVLGFVTDMVVTAGGA